MIQPMSLFILGLIGHLNGCLHLVVAPAASVACVVTAAQGAARNVACPFLSAFVLVRNLVNDPAASLMPALAALREIAKDAAPPVFFVLAIILSDAKDLE